MEFGDEIFEGKFISTVRIVCQAPPSEKEFLKVPFSISLKGENFVEEKKFRYYGDFKDAEFDLNERDSGPSTVGTNVKIYVKCFTAIFDENELLCQFEQVEIIDIIEEDRKKVEKEIISKMKPINAPEGLSSSSKERKNPDEEENEGEEEKHEIDEERALIEC